MANQRSKNISLFFYFILDMKPVEKEKKKRFRRVFKSWGKDSHKNSQLISFFLSFFSQERYGHWASNRIRWRINLDLTCYHII